MIGIVGIVVVMVMVFGGFVLAGGHFDIILATLPFEMMMIMGAATGAFLISNDFGTVKQTLGGLVRVFKGVRWKHDDYRDVLCLLFELLQVARANPVDLEGHIESPGESEIFKRYPRITSDDETRDLICDTFRSALMNYDDPHQVEEVLEKRIEASHHHSLAPSHALQTMADGLPALGIVAAVLGVIKTMGSIDKPPEVLGKMIGGALVGTFLGVFIAYGFVGPIAAKLKQIAEEDGHFHQLIREVLVANLHKHATDICIEVGRQNTPRHCRPSFNQVESALSELKKREAA